MRTSVRIAINLTAAIVFSALATTPAYAMTYSVSVYSDAFSENSSVYVFGNVSDNSQTGGCSHTDYYTQAYLMSPSGRTSQSGSPGYYAEASLSLDGEEGNWDASISGTLFCDCGGSIGYGGQGPILTSFIANYQRSAVYSDHAVYHRCDTGSCWSLNVVRSGGYPSYLRIPVVKSSNGLSYVCFAVGPFFEIPSCNP